LSQPRIPKPDDDPGLSPFGGLLGRSQDPSGFRGQALVETALVLPILLILLLGAIDLGRAFFGSVNLHQAARIGANYAAMNPNMTAAQQNEFLALISSDAEAINCDMQPPPPVSFTTPSGSAVSTPRLGDYATLTLTCEFSLVTPLGSTLFGGPIAMKASSTFPVRDGCVDCVAAPPAAPPATESSCRNIPTMLGMSVAGARLAWESAGFLGENLTASPGGDTSTVQSQTPPDQSADPLATCPAGSASFLSTVTLFTLTPEPLGDGCDTVPNLIGTTVGEARNIWAATDFSGELSVDVEGDSRRVTGQETLPDASTPGFTCLDLGSAIEVETDAAWPEPPPAPCQVPSMIDKRRNTAFDLWKEADFDGGNFSSVGKGNFIIKSQSLVGTSWVRCDSSIIVSDRPGL
jgi:hypothetical protein